MIPNIIHFFDRDTFCNCNWKNPAFPVLQQNTNQEIIDKSNRLILSWKILNPGYRVYHWNVEKLISIVKLYDCGEVIDGFKTTSLMVEKINLAKLFLIETMGGYIIDTSIEPISDIIEITEKRDLLAVTSRDEFPEVSLAIFGARPQLRCVTKARDRLLFSMLQQKSIISAELNLGQEIFNGPDIFNSIYFYAQSFWGFHLQDILTVTDHKVGDFVHCD